MPEGYAVLYGYPKFKDRLITDFSDHPKRKFHFDGREILPPEVPQPNLYTSAAGAYQATYSTWKDFIAAVGPRDFSPASQDEFCVWRISIVPGAMAAIESGNIAGAIRLLRDVWESFQKHDLGWMIGRWELRKAQEMNPEREEPTITTTTEEPPVIPIPVIAAVAPTLLDLAAKVLPAIASLWTDDKVSVKERNVQTAVKVLDVITNSVEAKSHQEAVAKVSADPAAAQVANAAILSNFYSLQKEAMANEAEVWARDEKSKADARDFSERIISTGPLWKQIGWGALIALLALIIVGGGGALLGTLMMKENADPQLQASIVQWYQNVALLVVGYFFGSSNSSREKTTIMDRNQQQQQQIAADK